MTIHFVWYWFVLGLVGFWVATLQLIRHTAASTRFDVLAAILYVAAVTCAGLAVVRDVPFVIAFSVVFGMVFAVVNWLSLRHRAKPRR